MAVQRRKKQSIFPDLPRHSPIVDKDGNLTATWKLSFANLYQALQRNLKNEGWLIPPLAIDEINYIKSIYTDLVGKTLGTTNPATPNISGQIVYDSTNSVPKMFIIVFTTQDDPTSIIMSADWKTFTLT